VSSCGTTIRSRTVIAVRGIGVPSNGGMVVIGIVDVGTLHSREMGKSEPPPRPPARGCVALVGRVLENGMQ
jgi:hypothetical protein